MEQPINTNGLPEAKNPFEVPENFFEQFEERLSARIDEMQAEEKHRAARLTPGRRFERLKPYLYFAAMFVLMFITIRGVARLHDRSAQAETLSRLENAEEINLENVTAEDLLLSELDSYKLMYYLYGDEDNE